jgi:hypothetical protein
VTTAPAQSDHLENRGGSILRAQGGSVLRAHFHCRHNPLRRWHIKPRGPRTCRPGRPSSVPCRRGRRPVVVVMRSRLALGLPGGLPGSRHGQCRRRVPAAAFAVRALDRRAAPLVRQHGPEWSAAVGRTRRSPTRPVSWSRSRARAYPSGTPASWPGRRSVPTPPSGVMASPPRRPPTRPEQADRDYRRPD